MRWFLVMVVGVSFTVLTLLWVSPVGATVPGENGLIAFQSDRDGDYWSDIYTIESDGTDLTRLTHSPFSSKAPTWSPDGQRIAFTQDTGVGFWSIVVMNADGTDQHAITTSPHSLADPAWSPDGSTIAFLNSYPDRRRPPDIFLISVDGSNSRRLTSSDAGDWGPEWSPDGLRIAFGRFTAPDQVLIIDVDGSNEVRLSRDTPPTSEGGQPSWAPHGRTIAVYRGAEPGVRKGNVWLHAVDGSAAPIALADNPSPGFGGNPAWSPDGSLIVAQDGERGLELWNSDGSDSTKLTTYVATDDGGNVGDAEPEWQPVNPYPMGLVDPAFGEWHLRDASGKVVSFFYGNPGDYPFMGDWDCDGIDTPGLYRQSDGYVYLRNSNTQGNADLAFYFGNPGDIPIAGDFNGDGCDTVSIYRPSQSQVFIVNMLGSADTGLGAADHDYYFGDPGDTPFVGDFDGDGTDTIGLYRQTTGFVYYRNTHTQGTADNQFYFGNPQDRFVTNDWNHDGIDSPAIYRPGTTTHYFRFNNTEGNADARYIWGEPDWLPVTGSYTHN
jgi:Tol biopolymer transport system component